MPLSPGARLGPYEIVSPLGAGGMGEVYRARDTRLDRTVAIKVLSSSLTATSELKSRFEREARAISQLNHPNICTLHDIGSEGTTDFLVMEFLEGETLADRLRRGALPLDQVLKIGMQIADALDKAHRAGIVHRDLKPGNVMLTKSGAKLLDFGLAKPLGMANSATAAPLLSAAITATSPSPAASPLTTQGTVVGTIQYMSPEQLQGCEADARSDIFALGAVLYEMTSGRRAFEGKSQLSVATAILEKDPEPLATANFVISPALDHVITRALVKEPDERWQSAADIRAELQWIAAAAAAPQPAVSTPLRGRQMLWIAIAAVFAIVAGAFWWMPRGWRYDRAIVSSIAPPAGGSFVLTGNNGGPVEISPDGRKLAFLASGSDGRSQIWVRDLAEAESRPLPGTENGEKPFWSPDSRSLGFFADRKLKRIDIAGGPPITLCDAASPRGGAWSSAGVILFTPDVTHAIQSVPDTGGAPHDVTTIDRKLHDSHRWPFALPDGKHFLYLAASHTHANGEQNGIYWASLDGRENKLVARTSASAEYGSGRLLFLRESTLMAQPFNPASGAVSGDAVPLVTGVLNDIGVWRAVFSASQNGMLVYLPGGSTAVGAQLEWRDRSGKLLDKWGDRQTYTRGFKLSRDGTRLAIAAGDPAQDLWVYDLKRGVPTRLTFTPTAIFGPAWSPDESKLAYANDNVQWGGVLYVKPANGAGEEVKIYDPHGFASVMDWSRDGRYLFYVASTSTTASAIYAFDFQTGKAQQLVPGISAALSPDGKWLAYTGIESGQPEVYVASFPSLAAKWQISSKSGGGPQWSSTGRELFFLGGDHTLMSAAVDGSGSTFLPGAVTPLFRITPPGGTEAAFAPSPDGQRFLVTGGGDATNNAAIALIANWPAKLKP